MTAELPISSTVEEALAALPPADPTLQERARTIADERPIEYRVGTAEAEEVALFAGIKPMVRQFLRHSEFAAARARFESHGFCIEEADSTFLDPPYPGRVLYIGRERPRLRAAIHADTNDSCERDLGLLLGYPKCCIARNLEVKPPRRNVDMNRRALAATRGICHPRLNAIDYAVFHYISWLPCSFDCAPSTAYANAVASQIALRHGQFLSPNGKVQKAVRCPPGCGHQRFVAAIDRALQAQRLVLFEGAQISLTGKWERGQLTVEKVWPTARDRHPEVKLDPSVRELVARVTALIEAAGTVAVDGDVLFVGEAPILRTPETVLFPFGGPASHSRAISVADVSDASGNAGPLRSPDRNGRRIDADV